MKKNTNEAIELKWTGPLAFGSAICALLHNGFVVTIKPSKKSQPPGGVHLTLRDGSGIVRHLDGSVVSLSEGAPSDASRKRVRS